VAQYPEQVPGWALQKRAMFENPAFQRLYLTADQAAGWDRDDPRLEALADEVNGFGGLHAPDTEGAEPILALDALVAVTLMAAQTGKPVPAWERLIVLCRSRAGSTGTGSGTAAPSVNRHKYSARELRISPAVFVLSRRRDAGSGSSARSSRGCRLRGPGRTCGRRGGTSVR
jgi:hypothetical protein